mmetsp:Transcript_44405/g.115409  ORF Transcript_44405/g.115409 Transcript_44405/m.115409 type:complete len:103 (+) Transcript_44405:648-956(+)
MRKCYRIFLIDVCALDVQQAKDPVLLTGGQESTELKKSLFQYFFSAIAWNHAFFEKGLQFLHPQLLHFGFKRLFVCRRRHHPGTAFSFFWDQSKGDFEDLSG